VADDSLQRVARCADKASAATAERNEAIRAAHDQGRSLRAIAEAASLSVEGVRRIIARIGSP